MKFIFTGKNNPCQKLQRKKWLTVSCLIISLSIPFSRDINMAFSLEVKRLSLGELGSGIKSSTIQFQTII